jgi:quercetin dioxygenase-like cupin family protein
MLGTAIDGRGRNHMTDLQPVHVDPDEGPSVFLVGDTYTTLLSGEQTGGAFTLLEAIVMPDAGPPPHAHHGEEETFVLLDGRMTFTVAGRTYDAAAGTVLLVPRDAPHSYRNVGDGPARMLFMYSPPGMEGMFPELGAPGRRGAIPPPLDPADITAMAAVADKYGFSFVTSDGPNP